MRTYTGKIIAAGVDRLTVELADGPLEMRCSARVAVQAAATMGRRVQFTAELSEATLSLTSPILVVGSSYGLRAVEAS